MGLAEDILSDMKNESIFFGSKSSDGRQNPIDDGGPGFNDEQNGIRGEQEGNELNIHAENRPRNSDGEFI